MFAPKASPRPKGLPIQMGAEEFQLLLGNAARIGIVLIACVVGIAALMIGRALLLPVALAVIVGLMFGPVADNLERRGISPGVSAAIVVLILIFLIVGSILSFAVPLSEWVARAPLIWEKFRASLMDLKEPLEALSGLQDQVKRILGGGATMEVTVAEGNPVTDIAFLAPAILGEILVFLVSLYFYLATRQNIRISILSLCVTRRLRWRTAHVFRDVETKVSRFLLSVTLPQRLRRRRDDARDVVAGAAVAAALGRARVHPQLHPLCRAGDPDRDPARGRPRDAGRLGRDPRAGRGLPRRQLHRGAGDLPALRRAVGRAQPVPHLPLDHLLDLGLGAVRGAGRGAVAPHRAVVPRPRPAEPGAGAATAGAEDRRR